MVWVDHKTAYDMVLPTWKIDCLKMFKMSDEIINFIPNAMENQSVELIEWCQTLA